MNPAKRRRLDATTSTLRKPFRSPLKTSTSDRLTSQPENESTSDRDQQRYNELRTSNPKTVHQSMNLPPTCPPDNFSQSSSPSDRVIFLQKQYSALTQELKKLRRDLDVIKQARDLHSSNQSSHLEQLIAKWQCVAQSAADDMFTVISRQVKDMGGLRVWQKQTQKSSQSARDDDNALSGSHQYRETSDNERDQNIRFRTADEKDEDEDEHSFTMLTMLRQFNIDPTLLKFNEQDDTWAS